VLVTFRRGERNGREKLLKSFVFKFKSYYNISEFLQGCQDIQPNHSGQNDINNNITQLNGVSGVLLLLSYYHEVLNLYIIHLCL
jgi:hypothetical protein